MANAELAEWETSDEVLVVAALLGDLEAFDALALRYRPAVIRTARRMVGVEDAEDVAQEALLLAFKALPSLEDPGKFAVWLSAITRHFAYRFSRRERVRSQGRVALDDLLLETVPALSRPWVWQDEESGYIERIPPDYALALQLHILDEMPMKRIAAFLGISLATVKWRVFRGKQLLRNEIERTSRIRKWKKNRK